MAETVAVEVHDCAELLHGRGVHYCSRRGVVGPDGGGRWYCRQHAAARNWVDWDAERAEWEAFCAERIAAQSQRQRERAAWGLLPDEARFLRAVIKTLGGGKPLSRSDGDGMLRTANQQLRRIRALLDATTPATITESTPAHARQEPRP